jgi:hypothetical protein
VTVVAAPLLSTYQAGENRVTASTMAVFERLDLGLVQELLGAATGSGEELRAVTFENQVVASSSVPDGRISARFTWWFETKTERGAYTTDGRSRRQLREHTRLLEGDPEALLFVLTPDLVRPAWFDDLNGVAEDVQPRVLWVSFRDLADHITAAIEDPARLQGEQTRFLLAELVALYEHDGLLTADDTVIVAAQAAWPEYQQFNAYVCQPDRAFRGGLTHMGFYTNGAIQPLIPRIRALPVHPVQRRRVCHLQSRWPTRGRRAHRGAPRPSATDGRRLVRRRSPLQSRRHRDCAPRRAGRE